jgi:hypothetical protein
VRLRHADFAKAQHLITDELKSITFNSRDITAQINAAKKSRNKPLAFRLKRGLEKEKFKETIIRKLADSIAWQLTDGRNDLIQWLHGYQKPPAIDESNLTSVLDEVNILNQHQPLSFAMVSDLTSFVQVGDILMRDASAAIKLIEVKEGEANQKAIAILEEKLLAGEDNLDFKALENTHGPRLAQQVRRTYKQLRRGSHVRDIVNTGEGKDPDSGNSVKIQEPSRVPAYYTRELADLLLELERKDWAYTIIDNSLKIGCYKNMMKRVGKSILELLTQTFLQKNCMIVNFRDGLYNPTAEPIFLKPFREDDIFDIIFDRTRVFMALNLDWIIQAFREGGIRADWLSRKETTKLLQREKYDRPFVFEGRTISAENEKWSLLLTDAPLRRVFFDNLLPSSIISMFLESMNIQD